MTTHQNPQAVVVRFSPLDPIGAGGGPSVYVGPALIPVDTGQGQAAAASRVGLQISHGVYIDDRKHLGIGVGDMALVKPTGDALMSTAAWGHAARGGDYTSPWGGVYNPTPGTVKTDGGAYTKTLNPVQPAVLIPSEQLIISDLAGNGGPLMGEIALQPLLDLQALAATGAGNF